MANNFPMLRECIVSVPKLSSIEMKRGLGANDLRNKIMKRKNKSIPPIRLPIKQNNDSLQYSVDYDLTKGSCKETYGSEKLPYKDANAEEKEPCEGTYGGSKEHHKDKNLTEKVETLSRDGENLPIDNEILTKEEEKRLLADADELSLMSETINEEELLHEEELLYEEEDEKEKEEQQDGNKEKYRSQFPESHVLIKNHSVCEDDIFETLSLAATTCEFSDELEPKAKKQLPKSLVLAQSSEEKVSRWKQHMESDEVEIPKYSSLPKKRNPKSKRPRFASNVFAKPVPPPTTTTNFGSSFFQHSAISSKPNLTDGIEVNHSSPDSRILKSVCYKFQSFGYCPNKECKFWHVSGMKRAKTKKQLRKERQMNLLLQEDVPVIEDVPAIEDYKKLKRQNEELIQQSPTDPSNPIHMEPNHHKDSLKLSPHNQEHQRNQNQSHVSSFQNRPTEQLLKNNNAFDFDKCNGSRFSVPHMPRNRNPQNRLPPPDRINGNIQTRFMHPPIQHKVNHQKKTKKKLPRPFLHPCIPRNGSLQNQFPSPRNQNENVQFPDPIQCNTNRPIQHNGDLHSQFQPPQHKINGQPQGPFLLMQQNTSSQSCLPPQNVNLQAHFSQSPPMQHIASLPVLFQPVTNKNALLNQEQHMLQHNFPSNVLNHSVQIPGRVSVQNIPQNQSNEPFRSEFSPPGKKKKRSDQGVIDITGKSFDDLNVMLKNCYNDLESGCKIIKAMNAVASTEGQKKVFRKHIEVTFTKIHEDIRKKEYKTIYVKIARELIELKEKHEHVKREDLFILAECESRGHCFKNVIAILRDMRARRFEIEGIDEDRSDCKELFHNTIERQGFIMEFWKDFRADVLSSYKVVDMLLSTVTQNVLEKSLEEKDVQQLLKYLLENKEFKQISDAAKTTFLSLVPNLLGNLSNTTELFDFMELYIDSFKAVPKKVVEMVLSMSQSIPDILKPFKVLKGMLQVVPSNIWCEFSKQWNDLLIYYCRREGMQIVEQYYGVMQQSKVVPTIECALMMLSGFVKTLYFEVFETRFQDFLKLEVFPTDFLYPDRFAQDVSDNIENYNMDDKNCLHFMVSILLSSNYPPPEPCINDVLNMLVSKRRFSDVYKLVTKCFDCSIILSQQELRRVIYALEEWMQNVDASVEIYKKMREKYPRPEHQCVCGGNVKPQSITSRISSFGELASPKSSISSHEVVDAEIAQPTVKAMPDAFEKCTIKIAAELSAAFEDPTRFGDVFDKACASKITNHEKILAGLFLGITGNKNPSSFFETFVLALFSRHKDTQGFENTLGRVGVRLIKYFYDRSNYTGAAWTVRFLHEYSITYANCGAPFGTQMETKEILTAYDMAEICYKCCLYQDEPDLAQSVFNHFKDLLKDDEQQIIPIASLIIQHLIHKFPKKAFQMLIEYHEKVDQGLVESLLNSTVLSLEREKNTEDIFEAEKFFKHNSYSMYEESLKTFVNVYGKCQRMDDAMRLYRHGLLLKFYQETFNDPFYHIEIPTRLRSTEIQLAIELHLTQLCNHPFYGVEGKEFAKSLLHLVVEPGMHEDVDGEQYSHEVSVTMQMIAYIITKEFSPALQILGSGQQKYTVSPKSILEWFEQKCDRDQNKQCKRKRQIDNQENNLLMTIHPTPVATFSENNDNADDTTSIQEAVVVNTQWHDKRVLVQFSQTNNHKEAKLSISKVIDKILKEYYVKCSKLPSGRFKETFALLRESYTKKMQSESGCLYYNEETYHDIKIFIENYFSQQETNYEILSLKNTQPPPPPPPPSNRRSQKQMKSIRPVTAQQT